MKRTVEYKTDVERLQKAGRTTFFRLHVACEEEKKQTAEIDFCSHSRFNLLKLLVLFIRSCFEAVRHPGAKGLSQLALHGTAIVVE